MKNIQSQQGMTLMELVITLAIIGVLAAIGTPIFTGYISAAKSSQAKNTLQSIYLTQKNFYIDKNYCYYVDSGGSDNAVKINEGLFNSASPTVGPIEPTSAGNDFSYSIQPDVGGKGNCTALTINGKSVDTAPGYKAVAVSKDGKITFSIDQNNPIAGP